MRGASGARQELGPGREAIGESAVGHRDRHGRRQNRRSFHRYDPHLEVRQVRMSWHDYNGAALWRQQRFC
jgi:hypothetical protein